jgi:hypothetical protein
MKCHFNWKVESGTQNVVNDRILPPAFHIPPSKKERTDNRTAYRQSHSNKKVDDIVISQINGREDQGTDNRKEDGEDNSFIAIGQE